MGITLSQKKRKFIIAATLVVVTLLTLLSTTQTQKPNSSAVLSEETLSALDLDINRVSGKDTTGSAIQVQIPGEKPKHSKQEENDSNVETKKLTNGNQLVKGKEGEIDESKVRESETKNGSKKIPLVAGDPTAKKAHDKSTSDDDLVSSIKDKDSPLSGGIKADKVLGSAGQKEIHDSKIGNKKVGGGANNNLAMKAQEDAELNGVSHNVGSSFNPHSEFSNILSKSPVVIFSKSYCPYSKKLKQLLKEEYHISPEPVIVELDKHENGKELQEHVGKQTGRFTVPNFIIDGESHGGADDILALHENDELIDLFHSWAGGAAKIKKIGSTTEKNEI